jgi:signal transduction histidine kinase/CheY-like chemotaxis protein
MLVLVLYFYWGQLPTPLLLTWVIVNALLASSFLVAARLYKRHGTEENSGTWLRIYMYLVLLQDAPWGLIGPMSFMVDSDVYRMLTLFMLGGMTAGAIISRALVFKTYVVSLLSLLIPIIITLALQRTAVADGMLALVLIYLMFMLFVAKSYSATVNRNILLWLDNEKLVSQLTQSHSEVEETNRVLTREIEHRKKIEVELVEAKERSERASEAKNQFLANVSHELRTPLNGIIGFADLLQSEIQDERQARFAAQIGKSGQTLLRIVNDILDITAIEAGHLTFYEDTFSLRTELNEVVAILQPMADRKSLELTSSIDKDVEDDLYGDANRLRQIVSNLISNALKYTEKGHISVHVSRRGERDDQVVLRFDIEDTGVGIAEEALTTIFDNFTRVEGFETRHNEGMGLGLAIVKSLLQKMDGVMSVRSKPGEGSSFSFEIPFVRSIETLPVREKSESPGLTPEQWSEFKVLVVDDNDVNRMVLAAFLTKAGIPYAEVDSGTKALEQIRGGGYDVVLMDIQMPDITGTEVAIQLNDEGVELPVLIAVTAHAFPEQRQAILDAGFADFLIKPISVDALKKTLTRAYMGGYGEVRKEMGVVK